MGSLGDAVQDDSPSFHIDKTDKEITKNIKLKSMEGKIFYVPEEVARQCKMIESMIEDGCADGIVPLPNVSTKILELVIQWCRKHTDSEMKRMNEDELKEWETKFVDDNMAEVSDGPCFHLFLAANYLWNRGLLDRCAEKVASLIRNKMPEEIRRTFGIKNDFTPEEEKEIVARNPWAFE